MSSEKKTAFYLPIFAGANQPKIMANQPALPSVTLSETARKWGLIEGLLIIGFP